jgi:hypothetical protein
MKQSLPYHGDCHAALAVTLNSETLLDLLSLLDMEELNLEIVTRNR